MKMENLKRGFKVLIVVVAALAIAATSFYWYAYSKATTDPRKTLETDVTKIGRPGNSSF